MKFKAFIKDLIKLFWIDLKSDWKMPLVFIVPLFLLLSFLNFHFLEIGFLQLHSVDEYFFHGSLLNIYNGFRLLKPSLLFRTGFYSYGFLYFFINFIFAAPFFYFKNVALSVFIPKMVTSVFALTTLLYSYKFCKLYLSKLISFLVPLTLVFMPGFWSFATWFHPDWMMTAMLIITTYYLAKDKFLYANYYWLAIICFGFALSFKFQALTFLPLIILYCFNDFFIKSALSILIIFIFSNPYLLHPVGYRIFFKSLNDNLISNVTNHGVSGTISLAEKIFTVLARDFVSPVIFFPIVIVSLYFSFFYFKRKDIFSIIAINFAINLVYLLFFVNKAWGWYYLPVIVSGFLLLIPVFNKLYYKYQVIIASIFLLLFISLNYNNLLVSLNKKYEKINFETNSVISDFIINSLKGRIDIKKDNFLITAFTGFQFDKLSIDYNQIHIINGPFSELMMDSEVYRKSVLNEYDNDLSVYRPFVKNKFIILKKSTIYLTKEQIGKMVDQKGYQDAIRMLSQMRSGKFGCSVLGENDLVVIFICE